MTLAFSILAGCAAPPAPSIDAPRITFIDAHVHLNDPAMQLALMETHGVERAVVFWGRRSDNASIAEAAARHPHRFIPFVSISPERARYRGGWERDDPALLAELDGLLATGRYRGIGEISVVHAARPGFPAAAFGPASATMRGILALARKHRVPVTVHCEAARRDELSQLLDAFPDVAVIWAHGGYSGVEAARDMLRRHPNLHYELSARTWSRHPRLGRHAIIGPDDAVHPEWLALIESQPQRFLVGTDASHHSEASEAMKHRSVRRFLAKLSPAARAEVSGGVLSRLVGAAAR